MGAASDSFLVALKNALTGATGRGNTYSGSWFKGTVHRGGKVKVSEAKPLLHPICKQEAESNGWILLLCPVS